MATAVLKNEQIIKRWGNGLAIRLPGPVAKAAHLSNGAFVTLEVHGEDLIVRAAGRPKLTLAQKLKLFDPDRHGGEVMVTGRVGKEVF